MWSYHCMHNTVTYKRGRQIATQTSRSLDWQHKIRQRDGDIFWTLIDSMWKSSYKSSAWRGVDQHLRVAVNLWIIVINWVYITWHGVQWIMGSDRNGIGNCHNMMFPSYNHKKLIDSSTSIWFNVEGLEYSTLMFIRNLSLRMMKLVVLLVILHQWMWTWCADKSVKHWLSATPPARRHPPTCK